MKLLVLNRSRGVIGGVETYLHALIPLLEGQGHEVWFAYETEALEGGPTVCDLGPRTARLSTSAELRALIQGGEFDFAFLNGFESVDLEEATVTSARVAQFMHGYQGACISGAKSHAFPRPCICRRTFGPACLVQYLPRRCGGPNPVSGVRLYSQQKRRQKVLQKSNVVIVASAHMRDEAIRDGISPRRVFVVPLFPTTQVRDLQPPSRRPQTGSILFLGRVTRVKGLDLLIRAIPIVEQTASKRLNLTVAGDGAEMAKVRERARENGVNVEWRGWVGPAEREALMRRADLLALPSLWPEPFGIVGLEAAAIGLPTVSFANGGITEWLLPGVTGEICTDSISEVGFAQTIVRALRSEDHLEKLRFGAWTNAARFTAENHLAGLSVAFSATVGNELA